MKILCLGGIKMCSLPTVTSLHDCFSSFTPNGLHTHLGDQIICWDLSQRCLNRVSVHVILNNMLGAHAAHGSLACD